jgi:hypothetical protein
MPEPRLFRSRPMPKRGNRKKPKPTELAVAHIAPRVATKRDALLHRLARLPATVKQRRGYKTATVLLNTRFSLASQATQLALLQAASFMLDVLEKLPPSA